MLSYESYDVIGFPKQVVCLDFLTQHWGEASDCSWRLDTEAANQGEINQIRNHEMMRNFRKFKDDKSDLKLN